MINIFEAWDTAEFNTVEFKEQTEHLKLRNPVEKYIVSRMLKVMDAVIEEDYPCIQYIYFLYERVVEDLRLDTKKRDLLDLLDKMEEDLMYQKDVFLGRAAFVLSFLEVDLLTSEKTSDLHTLVLGRIRRIRNTWIIIEEPPKAEEKNIYKPANMKAYLDEYIIGQEAAKKIISTALYGHMKRIWNPDTKYPSNIVLMIGPSGSGKTEIMRKIREVTDLPMVFTDVSSLGASQYRGRHKEDILISLWEESGRKKQLAERGIIFMDEFDKLLLPAFSEKGINMHDDVQAQLLTMLEGSDVELKVDDDIFTLNTSNILFVLAGAFQGIEEYIKEDRMKRENITGNIGFMSVPSKEMNTEILRENINHDVLVQYGMKRELAGRISNIAVLEKLDREALLRIMTEPKDSLIERYASEFELSCSAKLEFTEEALNKIADIVLAEPTGARALFSVLRKTLRLPLFELPGREDVQIIRVTEETVEKQNLPELELVTTD